MSKTFSEITVEQIKDNPFKLIGTDWMLITAGPLKTCNTMTASWGGVGTLWDKNVCFTFVRPTRHTYGFMEKADYFTLSFFTEEHRQALAFCGSHSGKDVDKIAKTGLKPIAMDHDTVAFDQARLILICRKIYFQDLNPKHFLESAVHEFYAENDYHRMYIGEIVKALVK